MMDIPADNTCRELYSELYFRSFQTDGLKSRTQIEKVFVGDQPFFAQPLACPSGGIAYLAIPREREGARVSGTRAPREGNVCVCVCSFPTICRFFFMKRT